MPCILSAFVDRKVPDVCLRYKHFPLPCYLGKFRRNIYCEVCPLRYVIYLPSRLLIIILSLLFALCSGIKTKRFCISLMSRIVYFYIM